jgi:hypothetical protein
MMSFDTSRVPTAIAEQIDGYLRTGSTSDPLHTAWPGDEFLERARHAHDDLRGALIREVCHRASGRRHQSVPVGETTELTRRKVAPMVRGLFPKREQVQVLAVLERSVIFLTDSNIERILYDQPWEGTAWNLANLYLLSLGAETIADDAPHLVGLSEETTCYVSPSYFGNNGAFEDFVVHEAAHIFHNCKRATVGLPETRTREWLLDIDFRKRETFAYSCEAYACILESSASSIERRALAEEFAQECRIPEESVDPAEVASLIREAAAARNGRKVILARCAPSRQRHTG